MQWKRAIWTFIHKCTRPTHYRRSKNVHLWKVEENTLSGKNAYITIVSSHTKYSENQTKFNLYVMQPIEWKDLAWQLKAMFRYSPLWTAPDCHKLMPHIWLWLSNCVPKQKHFFCMEVSHSGGNSVTLEINILFKKTKKVFNGKLRQLLKHIVSLHSVSSNQPILLALSTYI